MPTPVIKKYAERSGKSVKEVDEYWNEAKEQAAKKFKSESSEFWAYVSGIVKRRCGLKESLKDFINQEDILLELFDSVKVKPTDVLHDDDQRYEAESKLADGITINFLATKVHGYWDIEFSDVGEDYNGDKYLNYEKTNRDGSEIKVVSFVVSCIKSLIYNHAPEKIIFHANKKNPSRITSYRRLIKQYFKDYSCKETNMVKAVAFMLAKKL